MLNDYLRMLFYWPIRLTATCEAIPFEPEKHIKVDPDKPVVYLTVSSSVGNLLTIERLTQRIGWPSPFGKFEMGGMSLQRTAFLRTPRMFSTHAHVRDLNIVFNAWLEAAKKAGSDLQIIPITVLWSRNPSYEGIALRGIDGANTSWRKFWTLLFAGRDNCTIISDPVSALELSARLKSKKYPNILNRAAALHFLRKARSVVGQPFPNRKVLIEELAQRPGTVAAIDEELLEHPELSREELQNKARGIFDVMAADTRYPLLKFFNTIISAVWRRIYHGQSIIGAEKVRQLVQSGHEIIYIPCHRSHMDYILLSFVIFHEGLPLPQIASGDNLNFFPVGPIIRRCGSYFIRRKMKGDKFYTALFREYLAILFERGYATEFFIEGGRSRTGRMLPPRTGMVSMAVQAQLRGIERPIAFVPTYLGYEHVMEVGSYMHELEGHKKVKESAWQLLGIFKRLRYYGRGYVTFGEPVVIPRFLSKYVPSWRNDLDPTGRARPAWLHETVDNMSHEIIVKLNDSATVNGINLCALALINDDDHTISMPVLKRCLNLFLALLKCDPDRAKSIPDADINTLIKQAVELNKFHTYDVGEDMQFLRPSRGQTLQLTYFQNNILHLFALPSLIANILIRNGHIKRSDVRVHTRSLFYFLRHELFVPVDEEHLDYLIETYIDTFLREGYIQQIDDTLYISGDGFNEFNILSRIIRLNLIRYLVAVTVLKQIEDGVVDVEHFTAICVKLCHLLPGEVYNNSPEFADPVIFKILCNTLIRHSYFKLLDNGTIKTNPPKIEKLVQAATPLLAARDIKLLNSQDISKLDEYTATIKENKESAVSADNKEAEPESAQAHKSAHTEGKSVQTENKKEG
ncbi:MAG: glycerol-3-phosphate 1-O-acyltransferase PlsB [Proteobacteria bacterium]|uniref:Glycerol-3-phosphate acyltransferase n=1 Tax=Candidatus Avisuccinivibrio stercorigallinarum TaxID=2840704 RepID=A0A9D9DBP0_9GAMM|nr:glycerol-3-phosphate 1-O-acyltransferase PlsB [Candidatus Avisuccinivibrio stercorigallinarum]